MNRKNPLQAKHETIYEVPQLAIHASKPQLCLLQYLADSWMTPTHAHDKLLASSLMRDVFNAGGWGNQQGWWFGENIRLFIQLSFIVLLAFNLDIFTVSCGR